MTSQGNINHFPSGLEQFLFFHFLCFCVTCVFFPCQQAPWEPFEHDACLKTSKCYVSEGNLFWLNLRRLTSPAVPVSIRGVKALRMLGLIKGMCKLRAWKQKSRRIWKAKAAQTAQETLSEHRPKKTYGRDCCCSFSWMRFFLFHEEGPAWLGGQGEPGRNRPRFGDACGKYPWHGWRDGDSAPWIFLLSTEREIWIKIWKV